jgi:hypothetical protein
MNAQEWIEAFAALLDTAPPSAEEVEQILELAATAAHASERLAAPVACWLAARSGTDLAEALDKAADVD